MTEPNLTQPLPRRFAYHPAQRSRFWIILTALLLLAASTASPASTNPRFMKVRVTFYSPGSRSRTATGRSARLPGVAVDPRVIPLGSHVSVPGFGVRVADDTGGVIKGRRIDVRLPVGKGARARKHGVKHLRVRIVPPAKHPQTVKRNTRHAKHKR
jgi:3D (Asp-Asp-Asp) domain-containing protein